ncbi:MAG: HEPN family nuclease [Deltaproteobacteria bacterium]|nr:HEPN family nuclease [Deltaproteobacteria bacterium]
MRPQDVPAWCFLTGQFLTSFESKKKNEPHYLFVHRDFLNSIVTEPQLSDFGYANPGVLIMLCYGILVYPVELWDNFLKDEISMKRLINGISSEAKYKNISIRTFIGLFDVITCDQKPIREADFIHKFRNSIAHAHIDVDTLRNIFTFWNINTKNKIDFKVSISTENLGIFLTGLAKHFINIQKK